MKDNISKLHDCYGCGVCTAVCPVHIIDLRENSAGFFAPVITDDARCIECGLCLKVCAFNQPGISIDATEPQSFAGHSLDPVIRQRCSSGGVGFEIARSLLEEGYRACGVRYNVDNRRAEHFNASTAEEFAPSIGSKYIPSFTQEAFSAIDRKKPWMVSGTPCQIDSFRRYLRAAGAEDRFILLDFFCHGVPSMRLWRDYLHDVETITGPAGFVSWRNKTAGWHDSWSICADPADNKDIDWHNSYNINVMEKKHFYQSRWTEGDLFYRFFLGNYCLNRCCYHSCKYKLFSSAADIRIGDLWGKTYRDENIGTSSVVAFTGRGRKLLEKLAADGRCSLTPITAEVATESQMAACPTQPLIYRPLLRAMGHDRPLRQTWRRIVVPFRLLRIPKRAVNFICYRLGRKPIFH